LDWTNFMSKIADDVYDILIELFPKVLSNRVVKEHYVKYKGTSLFFDFIIKELNVLVEVQGQQHTKYIRHFHGDMAGFLKQKYRDNLKIAYIQEDNLYSLVRINHDEKITKKRLLEKINIAIEEGFCE